MEKPVDLMLVQAFEAHGIACRLNDEIVTLAGGSIHFFTRIARRPSNPGCAVALIEICVDAPQLDDRLLQTVFAGMGEDHDAAIGNAFTKFLLCPFHVLLSTLTGHTCDAGSEEWHTVPGQNPWDICTSPLLTQGNSAGTVPMTSLKEKLVALLLDGAEPEMHWADVFFAMEDGEQISRDVRRDNAPWPEGDEVVANWDWAPSQGFFSGRYFFMARPQRLRPIPPL